MRKILLATTALVAMTCAAQAAESPITVNVGGYVDFRAALAHESQSSVDTGDKRNHGDFETEYRLNFAAQGKAAHGMEYGAMISLWNGSDYTDGWNNDSANGRGTALREAQAYVWMSGAWGKALFGDVHGASDLFVYAPTVGEGQFDGTYTDFTDPTTLTPFLGSYVDNTENATKVVYYTPKVGNANHKVQLGVSYAPNLSDEGQDVVKYNGTATSVGYKDSTKVAAQYTGKFSPVSVVISAKSDLARKNDQNTFSLFGTDVSTLRDYATWGLGSQVSYAGFTVGGSYVDAGHAGTTIGQNKNQHTWTLGVKYEFDKVALAANYLNGEGYNNALSGTPSSTETRNVNYVKNFNAFGLGASYTWVPGLTTAADAMLFQQKRGDAPTDVSVHNDGYVLMLSQKMAF